MRAVGRLERQSRTARRGARARSGASGRGGVELLDVTALRGGIVDRCEEHGIALLAHSPLGGPGRARRLDRLDGVRVVADRHAATPAEIALAWLLDLQPTIVAIPGARTPEAARSVARAAHLRLERRGSRHPRADSRRALAPPTAKARPSRRRRRRDGDSRGGQEPRRRRLRRPWIPATQPGRARRLAARARDGARRVSRRRRAARRPRQHVPHPSGAQLRRRGRRAPRCRGTLSLARHAARAGTGQSRRALPRGSRLSAFTGGVAGASPRTGPRRPDLPDAGAPRARGARPGRGLRSRRAGRVRARACSRTRGRRRPRRGSCARAPGLGGGSRRLRPGRDSPPLRLAPRRRGRAARRALRRGLPAMSEGLVETALCPHPAGPPVCWCRPPLPGLAVAFAARHGVDLTRSTVVGTSPAHRTLATALGAHAVLV